MSEIGSQSFDRRQAGQALFEVLVAVAVIAILAAAITTIIAVTQRNLESARRRDIAASLSAEAFTAVRTIAESDDSTSQGYNKLYCPPGGVPCSAYPEITRKYNIGGPPANVKHYNTVIASGVWSLQVGGNDAGGTDEVIQFSGIDYTRFLMIENVCRNTASHPTAPNAIAGVWFDNTESCGTDYAGSADDPDTQRVTVTVRAAQMNDLVVSQYITRWRNVASNQSDWSGGAE